MEDEGKKSSGAVKDKTTYLKHIENQLMLKLYPGYKKDTYLHFVLNMMSDYRLKHIPALVCQNKVLVETLKELMELPVMGYSPDSHHWYFFEGNCQQQMYQWS
jgi:hypothetical protein